MPFVIIAILIGVGIGLASIGAASSVVAVSKFRRRDAEKKLKSIPKGLPRPPPGMTRNEVKREAHEKLGTDVGKYFNFAFCGGSGAGKSTLINALLNREDVDFVQGKAHNIFGSAPTGEWQTTMSTLCYAFSDGHNLQYVRLWDIAGCGTHEHPSATYFEEKALFAFDALMIVAEKELGEYEYTILENAQKQKTPVVIVITKAEVKVESKIRKEFNTRNPPIEEYKRVVQETNNEARERVTACLRKKGLQDTQVFIVSAWKYRDHLMDSETLTNINDEETIPMQEVYGNEAFDPAVSGEENNSQTSGNHQMLSYDAAEEETRIKNALLSFELVQLLEYLAKTAIHRRL